MTQPPDERDPLADRTPETDATADQPTIAWSPGGSPSVPTPTEPPPAAEPPAAPPAWPSAPPPSDASMPPAAVPPPADQPLASPASPIISASPSGVPPEPTGWQQPGVAGPAGPVVGWETPAAAAASAPGSAGYVISGMGARIVAYFLDGLIVTIVPIILSLLVIDWGALFRQGLDASVVSNTGRTTFTMEVTPQLILVTLIGLAIQFIYFVGFWTSGGQATPGMRLLKMKVVDAATGGVLSLSAATKRFIALGAPLALLSLVPIASIQSLGGLAQFALLLFLFFTAITNDRRQGLHDKWANSLVIRSATSGDGATLVGCLLLVVILGVIGIVAGGIFFAAVGPDLEEYMRRAMESAQPVAP